jgi:glycosyltransferase involved in cell wall biosynthesis
MLISKILGIPFGFTAHRYDIFDRPPAAFGTLIESAECCVTVTEFNKRYLVERFGKVADKFAIVTSGIETELFTPAASDARRPRRIVTVARLAPEKGLPFAIEAAALLRARGHRFEWRMIGEGAQRAALEAKIRHLNLTDLVRLVGPMSQQQVLEELRQAEVFVLPSLSEGAPIACMEAMATQTPIVATAVSGVPEVVMDGKTGLLVPSASAEPLAQAIARLLGDPRLREEMGRAGRERVLANFDRRNQVEKLLHLWRTPGLPAGAAAIAPPHRPVRNESAS